MTYAKKDALMTRGYAILSMLILHLFCRIGDDVFGTPLLYVDTIRWGGIPLVFFAGYFCNICVPTYSFCVGYAQELLHENGKLTYPSNLKRIFNLMQNAWIIIILFSVLGIVFKKEKCIPIDLKTFIESLFMLKTYNGAWWYLKTYIILLLIPYDVIMYPVNHMSWKKGLCFCLLVSSVYFACGKLDLFPSFPSNMKFLNFISTELVNVFHVISYFWTGAVLCKIKAVSFCDNWLEKSRFKKKRGLVLAVCFAATFIIYNVIHISAFSGIVAVITFLIFNLWKKSNCIELIFTFLGEHSTNIWLTHMFFYNTLFVGLVQKTKYPFFMLISLLALSLVSSFAVDTIKKLIDKFYIRIKT